MTWLAWRQFRTQALVALGLLVMFGALVIVTGLHLHDVYRSLGGRGCDTTDDCGLLPDDDTPLQNLLGPALLAIPALLGLFWGAPLLARELESGTYRLAWTQSVTRRRWLSVRVALVGVAALAVAGIASWLVSWWFGPLDAVNLDRFAPNVFTARGIVWIGYTAFAFGLGVACGGITRRTLPAMAATLFSFVAARIAFTLWVRPHLLPAKHVLVPTTLGKGVDFLPNVVSLAAAPPPIPNAWTVSATLVDRARHVLSIAQLHDVLVRACPGVAFGLAKNGAPSVPCQVALSHRVQQLVSYQPPSHYWPLQALETGIFLAVGLALIGATIWQIGRRPWQEPVPAGARERTADPLTVEVPPELGVTSSTERN